MLANATNNISVRLSKMEGLAVKASSADYSQVQIEEMQKEFINTAQEINEIAKGTEYNNNKIFTATGESISIPIGDGSRVDIFAKDFSFNAQGLDITTVSKTALSNVKEAIKDLNEYNQYLNKQLIRTEKATATIESEMENAMGIQLNDFTLVLAIELSSYTGNLLSRYKPTSLNTQANFAPEEVLQLLTRS